MEDELTARFTAWDSFQAFADAMERGYEPTFCGQNWQVGRLEQKELKRRLADLLDQEMERRGSDVRCNRCHW